MAATSTVEIQTDTHVRSETDKNYKWNVWDLKRECILLVNFNTYQNNLGGKHNAFIDILLNRFYRKLIFSPI